ncbi:hypothetical protein H4R99_000414 [Coemansia sp. RSA 1722]|nr:hypothetical protein H4R99_000414 [Coemansia sp. RSA 1722]
MLGPSPCKFSFGLAGRVKLTGPVATLPICGNKDSTVLEKQKIRITSVGKADEDYFYQFTNSWYGNAQPVCECKLSIARMNIDLDLQKIDWRYVDDLQCRFDLEASKFINLLTLLPNAKSVAVDCLAVADDIREQVYIDPLSTIKPLSTVLTTIKFGFSDTVIDDSLKDLVIGYLLIALPSLANVGISGYRFNISSFKDIYGKQYSHLHSVNTNSE